jgi:hypothetical protein
MLDHATKAKISIPGVLLIEISHLAFELNGEQALIPIKPYNIYNLISIYRLKCSSSTLFLANFFSLFPLELTAD